MTQPGFVESTTPAPKEEKASVWEDFIDIFYAPSAVFRRRINGGWLMPMLVVTIVISVCAVISFGALHPVYDPAIDRMIETQMQANPRITPDIVPTMRRSIELSFKYGPILFVPLLVIVVGFVSWGIGRIFGSTQSVRSALVVGAYSQFPRAIGAVVMVAQALLLDTSKMSGLDAMTIGPLRFVDGNSLPLFVHALLFRLDVFTIWATVLIAIGLHITGKMSKGSAAAAAALVWFVGVLPALRNVAAMRPVKG